MRKNEFSIPNIGLGTYKLSNQQVKELGLQAVDLGYRHIDTAQIYGNEEGVGELLKSMPIARKELFVTSKIWLNQFDFKKAKASVERSLLRLDTDYIDLILMHWPNTRMDHRKTLDAMMSLQEEGKVRYFGVSNFTIPLLREAIAHVGMDKIHTNQIEYHPYLEQKEIHHFCRRNRIPVTAYSPFCHGDVFDDPVLQSIADKHNKSVAQIVLRWLLEHDDMKVIPKASTYQQLKENIDVKGFYLDQEDRDLISTLPKNRRHFNPPFAPLWSEKE